MRKLAVVLLLVAVSGCAAPRTQLGRWAKAKGEEIRRLNEHHPVYEGRYKFEGSTGGKRSTRQSLLYGF